MKKLLLAALCLLLAACDSGPGNKPEVNPSDTTVVAGKPGAVELNFGGPIDIDSSVYVMYPLLHKEDQDDDSDTFGSSISSSTGGREFTYWNIVFYNTATKQYHLLANNKKMIIKSYTTSYPGSEYYSESESQANNIPMTSEIGNHIFYSIITEDTNKDGKLNDYDPTYLFVSDKQGNNLRLLSPEGTNVNNWEVNKKSGAVLMETQRDSIINNKKYVAPVIFYTYDLKKGKGPERIFSTEFNTATDKLYKKQWPVKKKE